MNKDDPKLSPSSYSDDSFPKRIITVDTQDRFKRAAAECKTEASNYILSLASIWKQTIIAQEPTVSQLLPRRVKLKLMF